MWFNSALVLTFAVVLQASKILVFFPAPYTSHFKVGEGISLALANAGHDVTMVSAFKSATNLTNFQSEVLTGAVEKSAERMKDLAVDDFKMYGLEDLLSIMKNIEDIVRFDLSRPNVRNLIETASFDLVIVEMFAEQALLGLGQHFGAPIIAVSTFGASAWTNDLVGNPSPHSYVPHAFSPYASKMNLPARINNLLLDVAEKWVNLFYLYPGQQRVYNSVFPNALLTFDEALRNVSLVFQNSHISIDGPRPFVSNMVEIGGLHLNKPIQPLPSRIQSFLDSATDGVIYFSLGSIIKTSFATMAPEKSAAFIKVFGSLKQKVIWKFEGNIPNLPSNIMTSKWLPQNDIFAHPNMRLFISHGGSLGTHEAIYHGLPILGMPFFADQRRNIESYAQSGWALRLDYANVTEESLRWALSTLLDDNRYLETAKRISSYYRDRPMTPSQTVVYWSEHVIRHRGAHHLRSAAMDLNFIQYHNLDALIVVLIALLVGALSCFLLLRLGWKIFLSTKTHFHLKHKIE